MSRRSLIAGVLALTVFSSAASATAEVTQQGNLRVSFQGTLAPHQLPREGKAPVAVTLGGAIATTDGQAPPQLRTVALAINRNGRIDYRGLPRCQLHQIQPATTAEARSACGRSLVGSGSLQADVALPEQSPFPSDGQILAFNGTLAGRPVLFAHVYGTEPLPQSFTLAFRLERGQGRYGAIFVARLPRVAAAWGFVSGIALTLQRTFTYKGQRHSYLSAGCPAPKGFPGATFSFARASFGFEDGRRLSSSLVRSCGVGEEAR